MAKTIGIGYQDFGDLLKKNIFYIDKTYFIKDWWENRDIVTLITCPHRFGKNLTMSMLEYFFSNRHAGQGEIFSGLSIWEDEETLQDTVQSALKQIEEKKYSQELRKRGVSEERIRKYGFAFEGKKVLIGQRGCDKSRNILWLS